MSKLECRDRMVNTPASYSGDAGSDLDPGTGYVD
jgi:hypothetical protein